MGRYNKQSISSKSRKLKKAMNETNRIERSLDAFTEESMYEKDIYRVASAELENYTYTTEYDNDWN